MGMTQCRMSKSGQLRASPREKREHEWYLQGCLGSSVSEAVCRQLRSRSRVPESNLGHASLAGMSHTHEDVLYMCVCLYTHTHIPYLHSLITLRNSGSSETPRATSTSSLQILISKYHFPVNRTRNPWKNR